MAYDCVPTLTTLGIEARAPFDLMLDQLLGRYDKIAGSEGVEQHVIEALKQRDKDASQDMADSYAKNAQEHFLNGLERKICFVLEWHFWESLGAARAEFSGKPFNRGDGLELTHQTDVKGIIKSLTRWAEQEIKSVVRVNRPKRGYSWTPSQQQELFRFYEEYKSVCTDLKNIYKEVKKMRTWRKMVRVEIEERHPDKEIEDDIIEKLSDLDSYAWCASNLAIEIAARLSHAEYAPFGLGPRQLKRKLPKKSRSPRRK